MLAAGCSAITEGGANDTLPPLATANAATTQAPALGPDGQPVVNTQGPTTIGVAAGGDPADLDADDADPLSVAARFLGAVAVDDQATATPLESADRSPSVFEWARTTYGQYTQLAGASSWGQPSCAEPQGTVVQCSWLQTDAAPTLVLVQDGSNWRVSHPAFSLGDAEPASAASAGSACVDGSSSVNFRGGPGTSWPRFTQIAPGTCSITVFERTESDPIEGDLWRYIEADGQRGWVVDRVLQGG